MTKKRVEHDDYYKQFDRVEPPIKLVTAEMVTEARKGVPSWRADIRKECDSILAYLDRGIPIKVNAPSWIQIVNVVFVHSIDQDFNSDE